MSEHLVVLITAPNDDEASMLARSLVQEGLIACANLLPANSVYRWQGRLYEEVEVLLVCKTTAECLESLTARVKELHSYDTPEIVALPVAGGSREYLEWVSASVG